MANKNIIKYLTETFEEIGNKEHENQFLEAMETLSEMNFAIKEMSFAELMDQSTWLAMNSHECQTDIEDFDDDSVLYETCRHNLLYWQTDVDLFYEEVCSANPELEWLDEFLVAYLDERICSIYPYLKDAETFNKYYEEHESELSYQHGSLMRGNVFGDDDEDVVETLVNAYEIRRQGLQDLESGELEQLDERFREIVEIVSEIDFEIQEMTLGDILQGALQNFCLSCANKEELKTKHFSMVDLYNLCIQYVTEIIATSEYFCENIGVNYPDFGWVDDVVSDCLHQKMCSVYPYLKNEDAFVTYVESLKNEDHE